MPEKWETIAAAKRDSIIKSIPQEWLIPNLPTVEQQKDVTGEYIHQFLSKDEIEITETDAVGIASRTTRGEWKALDVVKAFAHRAALAHQLTNCLLEIFFEDAFSQAQELDNYFAKYRKPVGSLHGLPVSLKDQFHVKGVETSMGYVGWIGTFEGKKDTGKERVFESEMVKELRALGAVLYCKTSVPHTLMSGESINNITGYVLNPKNRHLSAGGSSGGEGALIGLRGSPVGFGTDIGGSIRIPAGFNGLYGIRPSSGRLPYEGMANSMDGQSTILSVVGPIATTAESISLLVQAILSQQPWLHDPLVVEMPWREEKVREVEELITSGGKLAFGIIKFDKHVMPHPPVRRAVDIVERALRDAGHEVFDWDPKPSHADIVGQAVFPAWMFDGGADVAGAFALSDEPMSPQIQGLYGKDAREQFNATQISEVNKVKRTLQKEYMEFWNSSAKWTTTGRPIDAIISPIAPFSAARALTFKYFSYSNWVNGVDYTSVVVPVTNVDKTIDVIDADFKPVDDMDAEMQGTYDPDIYDGAHVSIQITGRRFTEEKTLAIAAHIDKLVAVQRQ